MAQPPPSQLSAAADGEAAGNDAKGKSFASCWTHDHCIACANAVMIIQVSSAVCVSRANRTLRECKQRMVDHRQDGPLTEVTSRVTCCAGVDEVPVADRQQAHANDPPAEAPLTGDAAATILQEPRHNVHGAAPSVGVQGISSAAADATAPSQHEDAQHALQRQPPLGQPPVGGASQAEGDSAVEPVASATGREATPLLPPPDADEQASANVAAAITVEARAPVELAADGTPDDALHAVPPANTVL